MLRELLAVMRQAGLLPGAGAHADAIRRPHGNVRHAPTDRAVVHLVADASQRRAVQVLVVIQEELRIGLGHLELAIALLLEQRYPPCIVHGCAANDSRMTEIAHSNAGRPGCPARAGGPSKATASCWAALGSITLGGALPAPRRWAGAALGGRRLDR